MWSLSIIFLSVIASLDVVRGTSLIDALNQAGASQFAALITSDPTVAAIYNSSQVQTVFAPIDSTLLSITSKRQTGTASNRLALLHGIQQTNNLGEISIGSGKSLATNDKQENLNGQAQSVVSNPSNSTGSNVARRWNIPVINYTFTTILSPPPPETITIIYSPPTKHHTPKTETIYSTLPPPVPGTVTIYSTLPAPSPETVTVDYTLPAPLPETVTIDYTLPAPTAETVTVDYTLPAPLAETVTIYSNLPTPTPLINPPSLLKIYSGLGNYVNIIKADIPYDGGLIQLVDDYFTLPELISATAIANNHTTFTNLTASANLTSSIDNTPLITCFIPTNAAFAKPNSTSSYTTTSSLLSGHIIPNFLGYLPSLTNGATFTTQGGTNITVTVTAGNYYINNAKIIASNLIVENGVCHVVDSVITPTAALPVPFTGDALPSLKGGAMMLAVWSFVVCLGVTLLL